MHGRGGLIAATERLRVLLFRKFKLAQLGRRILLLLLLLRCGIFTADTAIGVCVACGLLVDGVGGVDRGSRLLESSARLAWLLR